MSSICLVPQRSAALPLDPGNEDEDQSRRIVFKRYLRRMYSVTREFAFMLVLGFVYAVLTSESPKATKSPAAFPFFSKNSTVTDWYRGQLSVAISHAQQSDIAFVMYYAPWSAECQAARSHFEELAEYMSDQVAFAAVNCWQPGSECRSRYAKATSWPILIAYVAHGKGVQYRGPVETRYMMRFLMSLLSPVKRVNSDEDLWGLVSRHDALVLGFLNSQPGSYSFGVFYTAALQFLEKDPFQETAFAIRTIPPTSSYPQIHLVLWNETLIYTPVTENWNPDNLIIWILKHLHQVTLWVSPSRSKSNVLATYTQPNPALILFTPRNLLHPSVDYYDILHEIGSQYYNCKDDEVLLTSRKEWHARVRLENYNKYTSLTKDCVAEEFLPSKRDNIWTNNSCLNRPQSEFCRTGQECSELSISGDPRSSANLQKRIRRHACKIATIANKISRSHFSKTVTSGVWNDDMDNFTGLACKSNSSLSLLAFDSLRDYHFAERLGIDLSRKRSRTAVVIVNQKMETHHIMTEPIDEQSLRQFIRDFTNNSLRRATESITTIKPKHTHADPLKDELETDIGISEVNSVSFLPMITQPNKAFVVFYHSKQCAFCSGVAFKLLWVAKMFAQMERLQFVRIDGDLNNLPWEYTMETYPTILFVPAQRKSESRVYPSNIKITVPNLISFVLSNLDYTLRLQAMWILCGEMKFEDEERNCVSSIRAESLSIVSTMLRLWRKSDPRQKTRLLHVLQRLRHLNLLLAHFPQNGEEIKEILKGPYSRF